MNLDPSLLAPAGIILGLLCLSGFFSGSETALTAVSHARMHQLEKDGDARAARVNALVARPERLIGSILLGNNLVNILASAIATATFLRIFPETGVAYATLVMTLLVLVFAEVLPKTYAINNADRMAMFVAAPIGLVTRLFAPAVLAVQAVVTATLKLLGVRGDVAPLAAHDELRGAIDLHHRDGGVQTSDRHMLGGILDLRELTVADVMIHRKSMQMLDADDEPGALVAKALESRHTRLPLWRGDQENIIGVVHAKDLSRALHAAQGDGSAIDVAAIAREPWFVPETSELPDQLNAFRAKREHFAIVVDEYGALMGLVTLEDILEEIVGQIEDEHDKPVVGVRRQADGSVMVDGAVSIRDLNRMLDWALPDDEAVTIAGLVIHEAQTIPELGQVFIFHGRRFEIIKRHRNQISQMRVTVLDEPDPEETAPNG